MKTQKPIQNLSPTLVQINAFLIIILLAFSAITSVHSQSIEFCGVFPPHQATSNNPDSILYDRFGNSYDYSYFHSPGGPERTTSTCGYFELDFDGIADSLRSTICEVFEDLSDQIELRENEAPCSEVIIHELVRIYVSYDESIKYPVLASASPLYSLEGSPSCDEVQLNRAYSKINGGKSFPSIHDGALFINPNDTFEDNLDTLIWHTDIGANPGINEFDLYSVVLHEVLHILAFESRILPDAEGYKGYYSLWDNFIYTTSKFNPSDPVDDFKRVLKSNCLENCWSLNDTVFSDINEFVSATLANCSEESDLDFVIGLGLAPLTGGDTSLQAFSHLAESCNDENVNYVMQSGIKRGIESKRRNITAGERDILCLLGYKLNSCDGCYFTVSKEEAFNTPSDYHNTCCDPVFNGCIGDTLVVRFTDLLCNDFTNGAQLQISDWAPITSGISITPNDTAFLIIGNIQKNYRIQYTVKGCDCRLLTSIFDVNLMPCIDCTQFNPCENLICTEGFEEFSTAGSKIGLVSELIEGAYWIHDGSQENTPDICSANGNNFLHIVGVSNNPEGIAFKLSKSVPPECILKINMEASYKNGATFLNIHGSETPPCSFLDTRISNDCVQRDCGDYIYSPVCIDTLNIESGAVASGVCASQPNLQSLTEIEWKNDSGDTINYIIISPAIPEGNGRSVYIDNVVITYNCIDPCFSFHYVENCTEVEFEPCMYGEDLSHHWNFGDEDTSALSNPIHIYANVDTFLVTHILSDTCGNIDSTSMNVIVNGEESECCPDTTLSVGTTWNLSTVLPGDGRFHTITLEQGVSLSIEDGLVLEFCEGGALVIEAGAYFSLDGTLTSYGDMTWLGVFVEGDTSLGQESNLGNGGFHGLQQGLIHTREGSMIKNAKIGIRNYGLDGDASTGGMIRCEATSFINNTIGVDFGPYQNYTTDGIPKSSLGTFRNCTFNTDTTYHLHEPFHAFVKMRKADGMRFAGCSFTNELLPELPSQVSEFGFGIHAVSSGFMVYAGNSTAATPICPHPCVVGDSTTFKGLGHGIYVLTQDKTQPYSVYHAQFENCFRGITSMGTTGGTILSNTFKLGHVPDYHFSYGQIGAEFHFPHEGFTLQENLFVSDEDPESIPIGVLCNGLGEFDNEIRRNTFIGVETANQAFGVNRDNNIFLPRGLRYFCNNFEETPSYGYDFHIPETPGEDLIHPFQTPGSSQGSNISAGNHFAYTAQDFMNLGEGDINYWYYPPGDNEEPRDSFSTNILKAQGPVNQCATDYCAPPCIEVIADIKEDYFNHLDDYGVNLDNYINIIASANQPRIDSARSKALYYQRLSSRDAYMVVQHLMIDTIDYKTDSLIKWMGYLDTYGAEVMIAGEYAAGADFESALDVLETITARRDLSATQSVDLDRLLDIYYLLEVTPLQSFTSQDRSFLRNIAYSNTGAASGISRALLSSFGEYVPLPYYHGDQINFRNAVPDSTDTSLFIAEQFPLRIYPNPSNSDITIEWKDPERVCAFLMVYDFFGQKVLELNGEYKAPFNLKTDGWKDGVHWIIAQDNEGFSHFGKVLIFKN